MPNLSIPSKSALLKIILVLLLLAIGGTAGTFSYLGFVELQQLNESITQDRDRLTLLENAPAPTPQPTATPQPAPTPQPVPTPQPTPTTQPTSTPQPIPTPPAHADTSADSHTPAYPHPSTHLYSNNLVTHRHPDKPAPVPNSRTHVE